MNFFRTPRQRAWTTWAYPATSHGGEVIEIRTNPSSGAVLGEIRIPMPYSKDGGFSSLTVSNDGTTIALVLASEFVNVHAAEFAATPVPTTSRRLTFGLTQDYPQSWIVDSAGTLFESTRNGRFELFRYDFSTGKETMLYRGNENAVQPRVPPDGEWTFFAKVRRVLRFGCCAFS